MQKLVNVWMRSGRGKANPNRRSTRCETEEFFTLLAKDEGKPFVKSLFDNLLWTGVADNARILGMSGGTNHYERVYQRFDQIYRAAGALANPKSPVIAPQDSFDTSFIRKLYDASTSAQVEAKKSKPTPPSSARKRCRRRPR